MAVAAASAVAIDVVASAESAAKEPSVFAPLEAVVKAHWVRDADFDKSDR